MCLCKTKRGCVNPFKYKSETQCMEEVANIPGKVQVYLNVDMPIWTVIYYDSNIL